MFGYAAIDLQAPALASGIAQRPPDHICEMARAIDDCHPVRRIAGNSAFRKTAGGRRAENGRIKQRVIILIQLPGNEVPG